MIIVQEEQPVVTGLQHPAHELVSPSSPPGADREPDSSAGWLVQIRERVREGGVASGVGTRNPD